MIKVWFLFPSRLQFVLHFYDSKWLCMNHGLFFPCSARACTCRHPPLAAGTFVAKGLLFGEKTPGGVTVNVDAYLPFSSHVMILSRFYELDWAKKLLDNHCANCANSPPCSVLLQDEILLRRPSVLTFQKKSPTIISDHSFNAKFSCDFSNQNSASFFSWTMILFFPE